MWPMQEFNVVSWLLAVEMKSLKGYDNLETTLFFTKERFLRLQRFIGYMEHTSKKDNLSHMEI